ncbi:MAG: trypco2 family protein [Microcystis aeruginosa]
MAINNVGLRETLEALRVELSKSILASEGEQIRFEVGEIELEVQFVVEQSKEGKGGLKFWVVEMGGVVTNKDTITHRIKIPLKPIWKDGKPVLTGSDDIPD